jgi:replication factor C subunit 1
MSGGDRGGTTGIINMIKTSKSPIICICNDKQNQKLKSVINYCLDIKFHKPDKRIIVKRIM